MAKYIAQWNYRSALGGPFNKGQETDLTKEQADMFNRDSPGVFKLKTKTAAEKNAEAAAKKAADKAADAKAEKETRVKEQPANDRQVKGSPNKR